MVLFKDLNKASVDGLTKDFPHDKPWDVEFKHSSKNPQFTQNASVSAGGLFDSSSTLKYFVKDSTVEGKLANSGGGHVDFKLGLDKYVKGLTFGAKAERRAGKAVADALSVSSEYTSQSLHGKFQMDPFSASWTANAVASYKKADVGNFRFGGEVSGGLDVSTLKYAVGGAFVGESKASDCQWTLSVKTAPQDGAAFGKLFGNVHVASLKQSTNSGPAELSAEVQHSLIDQKTSIAFGGLWYTDATKNSFVKAKLNQDAKLDFSVTQKLSDLVTATLGTQMDSLKGAQPETLKYGLKLKLTA